VPARVIGDAAVRLYADKGQLETQVRGIFQKALTAAVKNLDVNTTKKIDEDAKKSSANVRKIFSETFKSVGDIGAKLLSPALGGARLLLLGAAAGSALGGVTALSAGLFAFIGAASQAAGAAGVLPAAFVALKAVSATLKIGLSGVSDSLSALASGDAEKFSESLKSLAPNARATVQAIAGFKGQFDSLKLDVQNKLFAGLNDQVKDLGGKFLPVARRLFSGIATDLNVAAKGSASFLASSAGFDQVNRTADNIGTSFTTVSQAIQPATQALVAIVSAGSTQLPRVSTAVGDLATKFAGLVNGANDRGALEAFFANGLDVASQLGRVIGNIGGALGTVFGAGANQGRGLLDTLERNTGQLKEFLQSAEGSNALETFFGSLSTVTASALPVLRELALLIGGDVAPLLANLSAGVGPGVVAIIGQLRETVTALTPGVTALGEAFGRILVAIAPILPALGQLIGQIATALAGALERAVGPLTTFINFLASSPGTLAALVGGIGAAAVALGPLSSLFSTIGPLISTLVTNAGGLRAVLTAVTGPVGILVAALVALYAGSEDFRNAVNGLLGVIGGLVGQLLGSLKPILDTLFEVFGRLVSQIGTALAPVITLVANTVQGLLQPAIAALNPLIAALQPILQQAGDAFGLLISAIQPIIELILNILTPVINALLPVFSTVFTQIGETVSNAMTIIQGVIDVVLGIISGDWGRAWEGLKKIVTGVFDTLLSVIKSAGSIFVSVLGAAWQLIVDAAVGAFKFLYNAVANTISGVIDFFSGLPGKVLDAIKSFGSLLFNSGKNLIEGLINGVKAAAGKIADAVLGPIKDAVAGVKSFLGISSPSKLFRQFGAWTGEGMVLGLEDMAPAVESAALALSQRVAEQFPVPGSVDLGLSSAGTAVAATGAGGGIQLSNVNIMQPGTNVTQFADEVSRQTQWDLQAAGTLLPVRGTTPQRGMTGNDVLFGLGGF
jgi:phage-related protein